MLPHTSLAFTASLKLTGPVFSSTAQLCPCSEVEASLYHRKQESAHVFCFNKCTWRFYRTAYLYFYSIHMTFEIKRGLFF